jgi:cholesterol oxidase
MALWPNKGEPDPRPAQGEPYRAVAAVRPAAPGVPPDAFGGLRLPVLPVPAVPRARTVPADAREEREPGRGAE